MDSYRRPEASEHYERAIALERAGRIDEALVEYRRAVDTDPGFAEAYEALGYHYQRRGLLMKALDAFETVARLEGDYDAYFNLGYLLVELERYEEALESFQHCLELSPNDPAALYETGYVDYILGRLSEALEALRIPQERYGDDWRVQNLLGACNLGLERWKEAEAAYQRALPLATSPEDVEEAIAGLQIAQRYQEYPRDAVMGLKERAYGDAGVVLLGTAGDDGLNIARREHLTLTPEAIAVTLHRLVDLVKTVNLNLTALVAVDRDSIPLADVLSQILALPRKQLSRLDPADRPLMVLLAGRQPEILQVNMEQAPRNALSFVLALGWYGEHDVFPDLIGVVVRGEIKVPTAGIEEERIEALEKSLRDAYNGAPRERNLRNQVDYYLEDHPRLRFLDKQWL